VKSKIIQSIGDFYKSAEQISNDDAREKKKALKKHFIEPSKLYHKNCIQLIRSLTNDELCDSIFHLGLEREFIDILMDEHKLIVRPISARSAFDSNGLKSRNTASLMILVLFRIHQGARELLRMSKSVCFMMVEAYPEKAQSAIAKLIMDFRRKKDI